MLSAFLHHITRAVRVLALAAVTALLASCSEDTRQEIFGAARLVPTARIDASVHTVSGVDASGDLLGRIPQPEELTFTLSNTEGSYRHTWAHLSEYPAAEPLLTGIYNAEVSYGSEYIEGPGAPYYCGVAAVNLHSDGITENVCITASLANTLWQVSYTDAFNDYFSSVVATLHSAGGGYIEVSGSSKAPVFLRPGDVSLILDLELPSGENISLVAASVSDTKAARLYSAMLDMHLSADGATPQIIVSFDESTATDDVTIPLTRDFLDAAAPTLTPLGFTDNQVIEIAEGTATDQPVSVEINPALTAHLMLTTKAPALTAAGWPSDIDLMEATAEQMATLRNMGLKVTDTREGMRAYDFTAVLPQLRASDNGVATNTFSMLAQSPDGRVAGPLTLNVEVAPVDISVLGVSAAVIGVNRAQMRIVSPDADLEKNMSIQTRVAADKPWQPAPIVSVTADAGQSGRWYVNFEVPDGNEPEIDIRILYCSQIKAQQVIQRVAPAYSVAVDGFAMLALVKITAGTPEMTSLIASMANVYIDGRPTVQLTREPSSGYIIVGGLEPNRTYKLTTTLYDSESAAAHPDGFSSAVTFATENNPGVPNGTFDEIIADDIKYKNLPAGGRFSQNIVDIYNRQNYVSYSLAVPKGWANTNAKTFCTAATRHNSWYMVPSVYTTKSVVSEESPYAVVIRSTAWDLDGEAIPDYRQTGQPYTDYSMSIPRIAHRAAGKLFLGTYTFNPATQTEVYREGVEFKSRPTALNGYYSFIPALNDIYDQGLAIVEVIGEEAGAEIVIARGEYLFAAATSYTAFSIPLTYREFGRKATKIKVLFASSRRIGSIAEESASVVTYSNPAESMSVGNELRLDNLTFSY